VLINVIACVAWTRVPMHTHANTNTQITAVSQFPGQPEQLYSNMQTAVSWPTRPIYQSAREL